MKILEEYGVTGLRHMFGRNLPWEECNARAEALVRTFRPGDLFVLRAEPDNPADANAIAVHNGLTGERVGYIDASQCASLQPLLRCEKLLYAEFVRDDGHVTFFVALRGVTADDAPEPQEPERVLPQSVLPPDIMLPICCEEQNLEVLTLMLQSVVPDAQTAPRVLQMMECYVPLSQLSDCHADNFIRTYIRELLVRMQREDLGLDDSQRARMKALEQQLRKQTGDAKRDAAQWSQRVFRGQLERVRRSPEAADFFERFDKCFPPESAAAADVFRKLEEWFADMPHFELRDWHNPDTMAPCLHYMGVTRRDLYDVIGALLLLQRRDAPAVVEEPVEEKPNYFAPTKNLQEMLKEAWFDTFSTNKNRYTCAWREQFVNALMQSEHRDLIAAQWKSGHMQIRAHVVGALKDGGVLKGSNDAISREMGIMEKARTFSRYMSNAADQPYYAWITSYVNPAP